mmetsp:Transcript_29615/g.47673  ORF Transcript_29615/g.47673 Transcript_29615/m.47673 type:complete len:107 (-) Transcript_29615:25-345(-)
MCSAPHLNTHISMIYCKTRGSTPNTLQQALHGSMKEFFQEPARKKERNSRIFGIPTISFKSKSNLKSGLHPNEHEKNSALNVPMTTSESSTAKHAAAPHISMRWYC